MSLEPNGGGHRLPRQSNPSPGSRSSDADILSELAATRSNLKYDLSHLRKEAKEFNGPKELVRAFPWGCLAAAFVVGYWVVPKGRKPAPEVRLTDEQVRQLKLKGNLKVEHTETEEKVEQGAIQAVLVGLGGVALRSAMGYVTEELKARGKSKWESMHRSPPPSTNSNGSTRVPR